MKKVRKSTLIKRRTRLKLLSIIGTAVVVLMSTVIGVLPWVKRARIHQDSQRVAMEQVEGGEGVEYSFLPPTEPPAKSG